MTQRMTIIPHVPKKTCVFRLTTSDAKWLVDTADAVTEAQGMGKVTPTDIIKDMIRRTREEEYYEKQCQKAK